MKSFKDSRLASVTIKETKTSLSTDMVYNAILRSLFSFLLDTEVKAKIQSDSVNKTIA